MELEYFVVDIFTETALEGNPLAVVMNDAGLSTERMQAMAREFNLSETTFVERRAAAVERAEGVRVRIFTTQEELPFAGHPTLGTASVLRLKAPEAFDGDTVRLALNVGAVPVQIVSTGNPFVIVALRSDAALGGLKVKQEKATAWLRERGARWFYVLGPTGGQAPAWRARMQFYGGEDPATGSAAGCAISYLVRRGAVASGERIALQQGVEMGRPSDIFLSAKNESSRVSDVRVAGSTVVVATGRFFLL
jgi:trans-2,3-dihydro-3-hydroxyanthranilate isomerase